MSIPQLQGGVTFLKEASKIDDGNIILTLASVTAEAQLVGSLLDTLYTSVLINLMSAVFLNIIESSILNQPFDLISIEVVAVEGLGSR